MTDTNTTENVEKEEIKAAETEDIKTEDIKTKRSKRYTLLINVKYGDTQYKAGEKILIKDEDISQFEKAGAIKIE